jgi:hypothetical protein
MTFEFFMANLDGKLEFSGKVDLTGVMQPLSFKKDKLKFTTDFNLKKPPHFHNPKPEKDKFDLYLACRILRSASSILDFRY